ncbi:MAG: hypothetical protein ACYTEQ_25795, partial [Planctomycetota bacterium]
RDAAEQKIPFETKYDEGEEKAEVTLTWGQSSLVYTIDMERDVVEEIAVSTAGGREGRLRLTYLQEIEEGGVEFAAPRVGSSYGSKRERGVGILWLTQLIEDY